MYTRINCTLQKTYFWGKKAIGLPFPSHQHISITLKLYSKWAIYIVEGFERVSLYNLREAGWHRRNRRSMSLVLRLLSVKWIDKREKKKRQKGIYTSQCCYEAQGGKSKYCTLLLHTEYTVIVSCYCCYCYKQICYFPCTWDREATGGTTLNLYWGAPHKHKSSW